MEWIFPLLLFHEFDPHFFLQSFLVPLYTPLISKKEKLLGEKEQEVLFTMSFFCIAARELSGILS